MIIIVALIGVIVVGIVNHHHGMNGVTVVALEMIRFGCCG